MGGNLKTLSVGKKEIMRTCVAFFLFLFLFISDLQDSEIYASDTETAREENHILFICSYSDKYLSIESQIRELRKQMESIPAELDVMYMEADRFEKKENEVSFFRRLKFKLDNSYDYDAVVLCGDEALEFTQQYSGQIFNNTPIFFYNVKKAEKAERARLNPYYLGLHDEYTSYGNISMALGLNGNLKRIVAITDDTMYGYAVRDDLEKIQNEFPSLRFNIINASNYSEGEIIASVAKLSAEDSAVFYYGMHREGETYGDDIKQLENICKNSAAPVYTTDESCVGHGPVGGYVVSSKRIARTISMAIKEYLRNRSVSDIIMDENSGRYYYFDREVLEKFGYDVSALPAETLYANETGMDTGSVVPVITVVGILFLVLLISVMRLVFMLVKNERIRRELSYSRDSILSSEQKMKSQYERLEYVVSHDNTTGLINRQEFVDRIAAELILHESCAFLIIDIDDFKKVNDSMGHHYGDEVIKLIADRIDRTSAMDATVARFGGDEFIVAIMDVNEEETRRYIEKLRNALSQKFTVNGKNSYLNFSTGIALYPRDGNLISDLIVNADLALNRVKAAGKDSYAFFSEDMKREAGRKEEIETILRRAINENGFEVYYQPKVDLKTAKISGFEALIRLKDKSIGPSVFIPVAEETGLIITIDRWVTSEVIKRLSQWKIMGLSNVPVSVNYSARQMKDREYPAYVKGLLEAENVEPELLDIEITEGIFIDDNSTSKELVAELRQIGVTLSMDDFGTGYSSLNYLNYIDADYVKLDKSMMDRYLEKNDEVITCTIALIHSLGLKVVAEGIDDRNNCVRIRESGCDYVQGNLFGEAMPAEKATQLHDSYVDLGI